MVVTVPDDRRVVAHRRIRSGKWDQLRTRTRHSDQGLHRSPGDRSASGSRRQPSAIVERAGVSQPLLHRICVHPLVLPLLLAAVNSIRMGDVPYEANGPLDGGKVSGTQVDASPSPDASTDMSAFAVVVEWSNRSGSRGA